MPFSLVHLSHSLSWLVEKSKTLGESGWNQGAMAFVDAISALVLGIILVNVLLVRTQSKKETAGFKRWIKPVVLGGWVLGLITVVVIAAVWPRGGWVVLHPEHTPGHRAITAVAYDPVRQRAVLFGGVSEWIGTTFSYERDTWEWDGNDWIEMKPKTAPSARAGHMMTYDEKRGEVIMFGGEHPSGSYMLADTWTWDGKDWKQMLPSTYPTGRRGGQLFYDPQLEKIILAGGFYYSSGKILTPVNDIWAWDGKDWEYLTSAEDSLIITNSNVAYDPLQGRATLFDYKQVKTWAAGQWSQIEVGKMPPNRFGTWLAADPESGKMLIFGGVENNVRLNDTWMLERGVWTELHPDLTPAPRDAHVMFFDPARRSFIVYGGVGSSALDDMWEYVLP